MYYNVFEFHVARLITFELSCKSTHKHTHTENATIMNATGILINIVKRNNVKTYVPLKGQCQRSNGMVRILNSNTV